MEELKRGEVPTELREKYPKHNYILENRRGEAYSPPSPKFEAF
jgi:hypothetical protein